MKVSFDFDGTLVQDGTLNPYSSMFYRLAKHVEEGDEVIIVTTRMDKDMDEVREFVKQHQLPVSEIHNTNFAWKAKTLSRLKVDLHYDDNWDELKRLYYKRIQRKWVVNGKIGNGNTGTEG